MLLVGTCEERYTPQQWRWASKQMDVKKKIIGLIETKSKLLQITFLYLIFTILFFRYSVLTIFIPCVLALIIARMFSENIRFILLLFVFILNIFLCTIPYDIEFKNTGNFSIQSVSVLYGLIISEKEFILEEGKVNYIERGCRVPINPPKKALLFTY
jgi:hypothetical protein